MIEFSTRKSIATQNGTKSGSIAQHWKHWYASFENTLEVIAGQCSNPQYQSAFKQN